MAGESNESGDRVRREDSEGDVEPRSDQPGAEKSGEDAGKPQRSIYDLEELDICPACGKSLGPEATVCVSCGYDLRENIRRVTEMREGAIKDVGDTDEGAGTSTRFERVGGGEADVSHGDGRDASDDATKPTGPFVEPGRGGAKGVAIGGVVVLVAAMTLSGATAGDVRAGTLIAMVLLTAYQIALHTATGIGALLVASRLAEQQFGRVELAAARMFLAFGLFTLVRTVPIPVPLVGVSLAWIAGLGVYLLAVRVLFNKAWQGTIVIVIAHLLLWVLMGVGYWLSQVVATGTAAAAASAGG